MRAAKCYAEERVLKLSLSHTHHMVPTRGKKKQSLYYNNPHTHLICSYSLLPQNILKFNFEEGESTYVTRIASFLRCTCAPACGGQKGTIEEPGGPRRDLVRPMMAIPPWRALRPPRDWCEACRKQGAQAAVPRKGTCCWERRSIAAAALPSSETPIEATSSLLACRYMILKRARVHAGPLAQTET
jgi:hypothetical protein